MYEQAIEEIKQLLADPREEGWDKDYAIYCVIEDLEKKLGRNL
jgi:hypothetical protein